MRASSWSRRSRVALLVAATLVVMRHARSNALSDEIEGGVKKEAAVEVRVRVADENVDESLYGDKRSQGQAEYRARLDRILQRKIESLIRTCSLNAMQADRLQLAGRGDIRRLFERTEEHSVKLKSARQDVNEVFHDNPLNRETSAIRSMLRSGPFEDESLLTKTLMGLLTPPQRAQHVQNRSRATMPTSRISADNAGAIVRIGKVEKQAWKIALSRDGTCVALVEFNKPVEIYSLPEVRFLRRIVPDKPACSFDFGPNENLGAMGTDSTLVSIVDLGTGAERLLPTENSWPATAFSPDGRALVTGGDGTAAKLWAVSTGELIHELSVGQQRGGLTPIFNPDGKMIAVGNRNSTTALFDASTGRLLHTLPKTMSHELRFDPTGKTLAVVYVDGSLVLWDTETGRKKKTAGTMADELYTVDWSPDGELLVTAGYNAPITFWNAADLSIVNDVQAPEWVLCARFNLDGKRLLTAGIPRIRTDEKQVEVWAAP